MHQSAAHSAHTFGDLGSGSGRFWPPVTGVVQKFAASSIVSMSASNQQYLTLPQLCAELGISRSTYYEWKSLEKSVPPSRLLPSGQRRFRRVDVEAWWDSLPADAAGAA